MPDPPSVPKPAGLRLPEAIADDVIALRRWRPADAAALTQAVIESLDHLRPWMPWVADEPMSVHGRRGLIDRWERDWRRGGDAVYGAFAGGQVTGGFGLHRRIGPHGLELGYWVHRDHLRRGMATRAASLLTTLAFSVPEVTHVEIHHDAANTASAGVARKLGFTRVAVQPDAPQAPAEVGIEWRWRIDADRWRAPRF